MAYIQNLQIKALKLSKYFLMDINPIKVLSSMIFAIKWEFMCTVLFLALYIMEPCDVGLFGPHSKKRPLAMRNYVQSTAKILTKKNFAPIFDIA